MHLELGAQIRTSDGQDAGKIDRLILDPVTAEIKAVVVHKGVLLSRDVEVPLTCLTVDPQGAARLSLTAEQVDDLPEFFDANYTATPPPSYVPLAGYPDAGLSWPVGYGLEPSLSGASDGLDRATRAEVTEAWRRQDIENAILAEGGEVRTRDGDKVGSIHHLTFDPDSGTLTSVVVRSGFIVTQDTELPALLIARLDAGVIHLRVDAAWFTTRRETLREVTPGRQVWTSDVSLLGTIERLDGSDLLVASLDGVRRARIPIGMVQVQNGQVVVDLTSAEVALLTVVLGADSAANRPDLPA